MTSLLATLALANLPASAAPDAFSPSGSLNTPRSIHTATLLANGKVLVTGGTDILGRVLDSAEIYDPATSIWTTVAHMKTARQYHTATLLQNGKVLVVGGADSNFFDFNSSEIYDPAANAWSYTGSLATARDSHTATLLPSGKVLVVGGYGPLAAAELYNPSDGTWTSAGTLDTARYAHTATLLSNGKVFVAGGSGPSLPLDHPEIYNPDDNSWSGAKSMGTARQYHTATLLSNGKVLVAGGQGIGGIGNISLSSVQIYDPSTDAWSAANSMNAERWYHTSTLLANGKVLVTGGSGFISSAELFDPATGTWHPTGSLGTGRYAHTATLLSNNEVIVAGGYGYGYATGDPLGSTEIYEPSATTLTALESWRLEKFGNSSNSGDGADLNDYDKDGIVNLLEFAFGLDPKTNSAGQLPQAQRVGNSLAVTFTQPGTVTGITYGAEWSPSLMPGSWQPVADTGTPPQHIFSVPTEGKPSLFIRLKVSAP